METQARYLRELLKLRKQRRLHNFWTKTPGGDINQDFEIQNWPIQIHPKGQNDFTLY